jgi:hypothetical protein
VLLQQRRHREQGHVAEQNAFALNDVERGA